ncbi:MAG: cytochrome b6f subunit family protein [Prochlorotrichaceae cyanobacterium]
MEIGQKVKVCRLRDRLGAEMIDSIKKQPTGQIQGFKMVDGSGVGVVVSFESGLKTWFFPDEVEPA